MVQLHAACAYQPVGHRVQMQNSSVPETTDTGQAQEGRLTHVLQKGGDASNALDFCKSPASIERAPAAHQVNGRLRCCRRADPLQLSASRWFPHPGQANLFSPGPPRGRPRSAQVASAVTLITAGSVIAIMERNALRDPRRKSRQQALVPSQRNWLAFLHSKRQHHVSCGTKNKW
jgi:hypothetical protein